MIPQIPSLPIPQSLLGEQNDFPMGNHVSRQTKYEIYSRYPIAIPYFYKVIICSFIHAFRKGRSLKYISRNFKNLEIQYNYLADIKSTILI